MRYVAFSGILFQKTIALPRNIFYNIRKRYGVILWQEQNIK